MRDCSFQAAAPRVYSSSFQKRSSYRGASPGRRGGVSSHVLAPCMRPGWMLLSGSCRSWYHGECLLRQAPALHVLLDERTVDPAGGGDRSNCGCARDLRTAQTVVKSENLVQRAAPSGGARMVSGNCARRRWRSSFRLSRLRRRNSSWWLAALHDVEVVASDVVLQRLVEDPCSRKQARRPSGFTSGAQHPRSGAVVPPERYDMFRIP